MRQDTRWGRFAFYLCMLLVPGLLALGSHGGNSLKIVCAIVVTMALILGLYFGIKNIQATVRRVEGRDDDGTDS